MKRLLYILLLMLLPICAGTAAGEPYYIVDGQPGVKQKDLPPKEEIARTIVLKADEAMDIYGDKAADGAVIISTKDFDKDHRIASKSRSGRASRSHSPKHNWMKIVAFLLFLFAPKLIIVLIAVIRQLLIDQHVIAESVYDPGRIDPDGVELKATSAPYFYVNMILLLSAVAVLGWCAYMLMSGSMDGMLVFAFVMLLTLGGLLAAMIYAYALKAKCYLKIDRKGIRGVCTEVQKIAFKPKFREVDLTWEQIGKAEIVVQGTGKYATDALALYPSKESENPMETIVLDMLSTRKVIDSVNFFYARHKGQTDGKDWLIEPPSFVENPLLVWGVWIVVIALVFVLLWNAG